MLYNSLVSLVVAFAVASGAAAAATPEARGGGGDHGGQCSGGTAYCCNTVTNSKDPALAVVALLFQLDPNLVDGLGCTTVVGGNCNSNQLCCQNSYEDSGSLIAINCNQVVL